jgi:hypothetical protein
MNFKKIDFYDINYLKSFFKGDEVFYYCIKVDEVDLPIITKITQADMESWNDDYIVCGLWSNDEHVDMPKLVHKKLINF